MDYNWNWSVLFNEPYWGWIWSGFFWTLIVASSAWVIAFILGSLIGIARTINRPIIGWMAAIYVEVFRNVPLLVQMFVWYFVVPELVPPKIGLYLKREMPLPAVSTAIVSLGLYTACRVAEQLRAGIQALPRGQIYAGRSNGMSMPQVYRYILLPVAYRIIIPPLTSEFLSIFKNSSLALTIGVLELTARARQIAEYSFQTFEAFTAATILYLGVTLGVTLVMRLMESHTRIPGMVFLGAK
jgi:glutamate/aspartate transport system permease protein